MPLRNVYRSWVLRTSEKGKRERPRCVGTIGDKNYNKIISTAHLELLNKLYEISLDEYTNQDKLHTIYSNVYETANY
jgi:hypothetical protein